MGGRNVSPFFIWSFMINYKTYSVNAAIRGCLVPVWPFELIVSEEQKVEDISYIIRGCRIKLFLGNEHLILVSGTPSAFLESEVKV